MNFPAAIQQIVIQYFGDGALPNYGRTPSVLARDPYRCVVEELSKLGKVADLTTVDSDLGLVVTVDGHPSRPTVRMSVVGPYALVTNDRGLVIYPPDIVEILSGMDSTSLTGSFWRSRLPSGARSSRCRCMS